MRKEIVMYLVPVSLFVAIIWFQPYVFAQTPEPTPESASESAKIQIHEDVKAKEPFEEGIKRSIDQISPTEELEQPTTEPEPEVLGGIAPVEEFNKKDNAAWVVNEETPHSCEFETFSKTVKRSETGVFRFRTVSSDRYAIVKNSFFTGNLPDGISATIDAAASKTGNEYEVVVTADPLSQRGSFNIPVSYTETTNKDVDHSTTCQFNLIVE